MATSSIIQQRAIKIALIVGSLLAIINHGDKLLAGTMLSTDWIKLGATYLVPYGVSLYSALQASKSQPISSPPKPSQKAKNQQQ